MQVVKKDIEKAYRAMAADHDREAEALEWAENLVQDAYDETHEVGRDFLDPSTGQRPNL